MYEMEELVSTVLDRCLVDEGYRVEYIDFEFRCAVIIFYSNITLPHDEKMLCSAIYGSDLYDTICRYASGSQIKAMEESIKLYISK